MGHALISPLNWGLGHSTRDIPIIRELLRHGHEVTIATSGNALSLLRREFPDATLFCLRTILHLIAQPVSSCPSSWPISPSS